MTKRLTGWHPEDIKAAIRKRGWTLTSLAIHCGLPEAACRKALLEPYFAAELAIAEALSESPRSLWPDRYRSDNQPLNARKSKLTRKPVLAHCQNDDTALTAVGRVA